MAEPTSTALGPRYAPDDPTLPSPWKGLIDGSTGLSYYWNPETNVTQYEKPVATTPPIPLAPIPGGHSVLSNGITAQIGQQIPQGSQLEGQQMSHLSHHAHLAAQQQNSMAVLASHQESQISQAVQHHGLQSSQTMHQPGQLQQHKQHMMQYQGQQILQNTNQHMSQPPNLQALQHPGQIIPQQAAPQIPHKISPNQGLPMGQHQGQYAQQQFQYMAYQPKVVPKIQQNSQQQVHHNVQGQQFANHQEYMNTNSKEEDDFQHGNQVVFLPSQFQQTGISSANNIAVGTNSIPMPKFGTPSDQGSQFGVSPGGVQQAPPVAQLQVTALDLRPQHLPKFQNQMNPAFMHGQQAGVPPSDMKRQNEENMTGRVGNEYYASGNRDGPAVSLQQPKLATIPMGRSHQEMRMSGVPFQNMRPGQSSGLNAVAGYSLENVSQGIGGQPLPSNAQMRLPIGSSDVTIMSPVENYCKQHEVTTTGDNVPAPFITFEATGFPPEILKEVRYLLRRRSKCRTLHCYWYTYTCNNGPVWRLQNGWLGPILGIF